MSVLKGLENEPLLFFAFGVCLLFFLVGLGITAVAPNNVKVIGPFVFVICGALASAAMYGAYKRGSGETEATLHAGLQVTMLQGQLEDLNRQHAAELARVRDDMKKEFEEERRRLLREAEEQRNRTSGIRRKEFIAEVFDKMRALVDEPLLKTNLYSRIEFLGYADESRKVVRARTRVQYYIENIVHEQADFDFIAQIDVSRHSEEVVHGTLIMRDELGRQVAEENKFVMTRTGHKGLQRVYRTSMSIPGEASYSFVWLTEEYELDLPYVEFWSTAHPILGMKIEIEAGKCPGLIASAEPYRPTYASAQFRQDLQGTRFTFEEDGVFLPYQGMFLRVEAPSNELSMNGASRPLEIEVHEEVNATVPV
jgi:hypothetical protein